MRLPCCRNVRAARRLRCRTPNDVRFCLRPCPAFVSPVIPFARSEFVTLLELGQSATPNKEALEHLKKAIESEPVRGEMLLRSRKLKRQLGEAKKRLKSPIGKSR